MRTRPGLNTGQQLLALHSWARARVVGLTSFGLSRAYATSDENNLRGD